MSIEIGHIVKKFCKGQGFLFSRPQ